MLTITLRTDKPEAEIGLFEAGRELDYLVWPAHRQLAETIHLRIKELLKKNGRDWHDLQAVLVFEGPGSFTGLRIGLTVANALAKGLKIPIAATAGDEWIKDGLTRLKNNANDGMALPHYGAPPHITRPKH